MISGPPWGLSGKEPTYSAVDAGDAGSISAQEEPLEEGTAAHSSILACRIPRTEEPGGLQSTGSQSRTRLKRLSTQGQYDLMVGKAPKCLAFSISFGFKPIWNPG